MTACGRSSTKAPPKRRWTSTSPVSPRWPSSRCTPCIDLHWRQGGGPTPHCAKMPRIVKRGQEVRWPEARRSTLGAVTGAGRTPVLDRLCSHFVLTLTLRQAGRFNLRRDCNSLPGADRPPPGSGPRQCWPGCVPSEAALQGQRNLARPRGPERRSLHRALRRLARRLRGRQPVLLPRRIRQGCVQDLIAVLGASATGWAPAEEGSHAGREEHRRAGRPAAAEPAERALLLYGTLARYQRDLRGLLVEFKVSSAQEAYAAIASVAGVDADVAETLARRLAAGARGHGREPDLRTQHHRPGRPDEGQRAAAARADARVPRPQRPDGGVHAAGDQERTPRRRLPFVAEDANMLHARCCAMPSRARNPASTCCSTAPGTSKTELAKVGARRPPGWSCTRWNTPTATATR